MDELEIVIGRDTAAARSRLRELATADGAGAWILVGGDEHAGLLRWGTAVAPSRPAEPGLGATRYRVVVANVPEPPSGLDALVLSEQRALRSGASDDEYETFMRGRWIPGVVALPGYGAAQLLRGRAGDRAGLYAYLGWFSSVAAREGLLAALGDPVPPGLRGYRALIDESFARFLDPALHRFLRLAAIDRSS